MCLGVLFVGVVMLAFATYESSHHAIDSDFVGRWVGKPYPVSVTSVPPKPVEVFVDLRADGTAIAGRVADPKGPTRSFKWWIINHAITISAPGDDSTHPKTARCRVTDYSFVSDDYTEYRMLGKAPPLP
jgi:hypothetical protein